MHMQTWQYEESEVPEDASLPISKKTDKRPFVHVRATMYTRHAISAAQHAYRQDCTAVGMLCRGDAVYMAPNPTRHSYCIER